MNLETLQSLVEFNPNNVEMVVNAFYTNPGNIHAELNRWLTRAQSSSEAWTFCWNLLEPGKPEVIQFFGINSLYCKISNYWNEIPDGDLGVLRERLFALIQGHSKSPRNIQKKICVTLSKYIMKSIASKKEGSLDYLHNLLMHNQYSLLVQREDFEIENFLDVLTAIPEDFKYYDGEVQFFKNILSQKVDIVLQLTYNLLVIEHKHSDRIKSKALNCSVQWMLLSDHLAKEEYMALLDVLFVYVCDFEHTKEAVDCIIAFFQCPSNYLYPASLLLQIEKVTNLKHNMVAIFNSSECVSQNLAPDFCRLVVFVGECCIKFFVYNALTHPHITRVVESFMEMMVWCIDVPGQYPIDETCSNMTYGFWYLLQDELLEDKPAPDEVCKFFRRFYFAAFVAMKNKVTYPLQNYDAWSAEEKESFRCFRQDNADAVAYFQEFLEDQMVRDLYSDLVSLISSSENVCVVPWQKYEGNLYMMSAILEGGYLFDTSSIKLVYNHLHRIPCDNETLAHQMMSFIASTSAVMEGDTEMFSTAVGLLLRGIQHQDTLNIATICLKDVFVYNRKLIRLMAASVFETIKTPLAAPRTKSEDRVRLVTLLGHIVSILNTSDALAVVELTLTSHVQLLRSSVDLYAGGSLKTISPEHQGIITEKLRMLTGLLNVLKTDQITEVGVKNSDPMEGGDDDDTGGADDDAGGGDDDDLGLSAGAVECSCQVVQKLMPIMIMTMQTFPHNDDIIKECCDTLRSMVFSLQDRFRVFLTDVGEVVVTVFQLNPSDAIVNFVKNLLGCFHKNRELTKFFSGVFDNILVTYLSILPGGNEETITSMMTFLSHISKRYIFLLKHTSVDINRVFEAGILGLRMKNSNCCKYSSNLMVNLLSRVERMEVCVDAHISVLLGSLIFCISGESPRKNVSFLGEVVWALMKYYGPVFQEAAKIMLTNPPPSIDPAHLTSFLSDLQTCNLQRERTKQSAFKYALLCRGILDTEYGMETTPNHFLQQL